MVSVMALNDDQASKCPHCKGTCATYSCNQTEFKKKCLNPSCRQTKWVPVAFEVHKKIKTVEGFRAWLAVVESQS